MSTGRVSTDPNISSLTQTSDYQASYYAHDLTRLGEIGEMDRLGTTLFDSKVDLNPHQVDAALFAMSIAPSPRQHAPYHPATAHRSTR